MFLRSLNIPSATIPELYAGTAVWVVMVAAYLIYIPAFTAPFLFDDAPNLQGLANVNSVESAIAFALNGLSSKIGRPLALIAFLPNTGDWPIHPEAFRRINVLVHLINGLLLAWVTIKVSRAQPEFIPGRHYVAIMILVALWLFHPFLASTSLMVVQRMALLAATSILLGLLAFVHGRCLVARRPVAGYIWMSSGLFFGAAIGLFLKENATLLPFFAASLNYTLLRGVPNPNNRLWKVWQFLFFAMPAILLGSYILLSWPSIVQDYDSRSFSLSDRLLTQPVVLWSYVKQIYLPNIGLMGPFQDDFVVYRNFTPIVIASILGWLTIISLAVANRQSRPWLGFAVFWFLAGHLLESGVFSLEMYFEHRNYIPSIGLLAGLVAVALSYNRLALKAGGGALVVIMALLLWQVTTLWGDPALAAERWSGMHPRSSRATQFLAQRYSLINNEKYALEVIQRGIEANPSASDLLTQEVQLGCGLLAPAALRQKLDKLTLRMPHLTPSLATPMATHAIWLQIEDNRCPGIDVDSLVNLITATLNNKMVASNSIMKHHLHHQLADIYTSQGNLDLTVRNLEAAFNAKPNPESAQLLAVTLMSAGLYKEAESSLDKAMLKAPKLPFHRSEWEKKLLGLKDILKESMSSSER
jgi:tetratricopeptide (TPR) repeat protein